MADKNQSAFETWVPPAARQKISELRALTDLADDDHRLLDRLATYPLMRTAVWERLPHTTKGAEDFVIWWAFIGGRSAAAYKPPLPRRAKQIGEHLQKYPYTFDAEDVADSASQLLVAMNATSHHASGWWSS